jgi:hypothetical protein
MVKDDQVGANVPIETSPSGCHCKKLIELTEAAVPENVGKGARWIEPAGTHVRLDGGLKTDDIQASKHVAGPRQVAEGSYHAVSALAQPPGQRKQSHQMT